MRKSLSLAVLMVVLGAMDAFAAGEARVTGRIIDAATKEPIADAVVDLEAIEGKTVKLQAKTKKDGNYALFVLDGTIRYKMTYSAPGYASHIETAVKLKLGEPNKMDIELSKAGASAAKAVATPDPAGVAYNEGAQLANAGQNEQAIAKFEQAIALKPSFTPALIGLVKTHYKLKNYDKTIEAAQKVLAIDDEDTTMWQYVANSYTALGQKDKAAEALKHVPANAVQLFNEAASLINKGNDAQAETLLKKALEQDDQMAVAYYELGMIYARGGKNAEAKTNLETYLKLSPDGKDAATAKEMLNYLK